MKTQNFILLMAIFLAGCSSAPPTFAWPDGSHRVPINKNLSEKANNYGTY